MRETTKDKVEDYISGLRDLDNTTSVIIGAILVSRENSNAVLKIVKEKNINIVDIDDTNVVSGLRDLDNWLDKGKDVAISIENNLPPKLIGHISNLFHNTQIKLKRGRIFLIVDKEVYDNTPLQEEISSVCRT